MDYSFFDSVFIECNCRYKTLEKETYPAGVLRLFANIKNSNELKAYIDFAIERCLAHAKVTIGFRNKDYIVYDEITDLKIVEIVNTWCEKHMYDIIEANPYCLTEEFKETTIEALNSLLLVTDNNEKRDKINKCIKAINSIKYHII